MSNRGASMAAFPRGVGGGLIVTWFGVQVQSDADYKSGQLAAKMRVLRRFAGNRHVLTAGGPGVQLNGEPFVALDARPGPSVVQLLSNSLSRLTNSRSRSRR